MIYLKRLTNPGWMTQLVGALSHTPKGYGFDFLVGVCTGDNQSVSLSHRCLSVSLVLSL